MEVMAELRTLFEIEYARDRTLCALAALAGKEHCFMAWAMGYLKGKGAGLSEAQALLRETAR